MSFKSIVVVVVVALLFAPRCFKKKGGGGRVGVRAKAELSQSWMLCARIRLYFNILHNII